MASKKKPVNARTVSAMAHCLEEMVFLFEESHAEEIENRHGGDSGGKSSCSYCREIARARRLLKTVNGTVED